MENIDLDTLLERNAIKKQIKEFLFNFGSTKQKGIFLYGENAVGKTTFIKNLLKDDFNMIYLNSFDSRNKLKIEEFKGKNMTTQSVMSSFFKKKKPLVIVIDDIETMNSGDKGGINNLVKILKSKKQEDGLRNPIICINNYFSDKKTNDLKKNLINIELKKPTDDEIEKIVRILFKTASDRIVRKCVRYSNGNLCQLKLLFENYTLFGEIIPQSLHTINNTFYKATEQIIIKRLNMQNYTDEIKETDKTSIALLFHENIIDILSLDDLDLYLNILSNICFGDYIDKLIFKHQLWIFNEVSFIIKILFNNNLLHNSKKTFDFSKLNIRFTKVLTKYSTEYSNYNFINALCQQFNLDRNDLFLYINHLKQNGIIHPDLKPLEITRINKFLDLYYD